MEFPKVVKAITLEQMSRISGPGGIHSDQEEAEKRGVRGPIAQGGQLSGYLSEMMLKAFGDGYLTGGEMAVSFIYPVRPGDTVSSFGEVVETTDMGGRKKVQCNIWLENQNGEKVTVGTAAGYLP